jgi:hypothetical protein
VGHFIFPLQIYGSGICQGLASGIDSKKFSKKLGHLPYPIFLLALRKIFSVIPCLFMPFSCSSFLHVKIEEAPSANS